MISRTKLLLLGSSLALSQAAVDADKVTEMDDIGTITGYDQYSGYIPLEGTGKKIFYTFVTSQDKPADDPVLIWFNGGPGCSSLKGFIQENGPMVTDDGEIKWFKNEYSFNTNANVLYIDQPPGVGFSYCNPDTDTCSWKDSNSTIDNLAAVNGWFSRYPEYRSNDLWLSGESYAGIYVPFLLDGIDDQNSKATSEDDKLNLKGFMVGNGVTNWKYDCDNAMVEFLYGRGVYSQELYDSMKENECDYTYLEFDQTKISEKCLQIYADIMEMTNYIDPYNIYSKCYNTTAAEPKKEQLSFGDAQLLQVDDAPKTKKKPFYKQYTKWARKNPLMSAEEEEGFWDEAPDCSWNDPLQDYFRKASVRTQLHVDSAVGDFNWCNDIDFTMEIDGSQHLYEKHKDNYRLMHFSGDKDSVVAGVGTLGWINELGWNVKEEWKPYYVDDQLAGYTEVREGLTFASVHGAGHMVPQDQRAIAHHLFYSFMKDESP